MAGSKQSKKSRKHGRTTRSPSHKRYNASGRREANKQRRIEKECRRQKKLKSRRQEKLNGE